MKFFIKLIDVWVELKATNKDLENMVMQDFPNLGFVHNAEVINPSLIIELYPYENSIKNLFSKSVRIGSLITDIGKIECYKNTNIILYNVADDYYLISDPHCNSYKFYLKKEIDWKILLPVALILYYSNNKNYYGIHAGLFQYKNLNFLVVGEGNTGKTTFLKNLVLNNPEINFICDDICIMLKKRKKVYIRGLMNSYQYVSKRNSNQHKTNDEYSENPFLTESVDYQVDKILFLEKNIKRITEVELLSKKTAFLKFYNCSILISILSAKKLESCLSIIKNLSYQAPGIRIKAGYDIKDNENKAICVVNEILKN